MERAYIDLYSSSDLTWAFSGGARVGMNGGRVREYQDEGRKQREMRASDLKT